MRCETKHGAVVDIDTDPIGDGAMKEVFFTRDRASVVCFYKDQSASTDPLRLQRLEFILGKYNPTIPRANGGAAVDEADAAYFKNLFCWPTAIVTRPRFGIVTPAYPSNFFFESGPDFLKGREKSGFRFLGHKNRNLLKTFASSELGSWLNYYKFCVVMARAVARLHNAGLAHSDLSPNNVLVDPVAGASIVIDIDSLVVPGLFPPDVVGTKGYIAPEVLSTLSLAFNDSGRKHPNARTDEHALAVLIYQYLLLRHPLEGKRIPCCYTAEEQELSTFGADALFCEHPTEKSNRPSERNYLPCSALGPLLFDLFTKVFVDGIKRPNERPSANDWVRALVRTWDWLIPCPNAKCSHGWYVLWEKQTRCPVCKSSPKNPVAILKLWSERAAGQWTIDGQVTVYHNLPLFKWHAFSGIFPGPQTDRTPQAYCLWHQGQWILVNKCLGSLTSPAGNVVGMGQALSLSQGARFRFSRDPNGRMAEVVIVHS